MASTVWQPEFGSYFFCLLGMILFKVILAAVFFVVEIFFALPCRLLGHDHMRFKQWTVGVYFVFEIRDHTYSSKEIELPF
jgi:hypothetical protein